MVKALMRALGIGVCALAMSASGGVAGSPASAELATSGIPIRNIDGRVETHPIGVWGLTGVITSMRVTLHRVSHTTPDDMDIMLIGPNGQRVALMSDSCGGANLANVDLGFEARGSQLRYNGPCTAGTYIPTNFNDGIDLWTGGVPTASSLAAFEGIDPNGVWRLVVRDDHAGGGITYIHGGWSLEFTTTPVALAIPYSGSEGEASQYPLTHAVADRAGTIADVNVTLPSLFHRHGGDIDLLLVAPNGRSVMLMADSCRGPVNTTLTFDDEASARLPEYDADRCAGSVRPTRGAAGSDNALPAPAPAGPYGATLSVFDGMSPNGTWRFYFYDDASGDAGYLADVPRLSFTMKLA